MLQVKRCICSYVDNFLLRNDDLGVYLKSEKYDTSFDT